MEEHFVLLINQVSLMGIEDDSVQVYYQSSSVFVWDSIPKISKSFPNCIARWKDQNNITLESLKLAMRIQREIPSTR